MTAGPVSGWLDTGSPSCLNGTMNKSLIRYLARRAAIQAVYNVRPPSNFDARERAEFDTELGKISMRIQRTIAGRVQA